MRPKLILALCIGMVAGTGFAHERPPLREVSEIDDSMLWVAIAHEISEECDEINPRILRGLNYLNSLRSKARSLGYTNEEIRAYHKSDEERERMRRRGEAFVIAQGLDPNNAEDLCTLGHTEIARNSMIGTFLRAE